MHTCMETGLTIDTMDTIERGLLLVSRACPYQHRSRMRQIQMILSNIRFVFLSYGEGMI